MFSRFLVQAGGSSLVPRALLVAQVSSAVARLPRWRQKIEIEIDNSR